MKKTISPELIVAELNRMLRISEYPQDPSNNGLQVEGAHGGVSKICCGVDATPEFYARARAAGAEFLLVHHGISWGNSLSRLSGGNYQLTAPLILAGQALYAAHLPLDANLTYGNNARIAAALGLCDLEPFGVYAGYEIGVKGRFRRAVPWGKVLEKLRECCPDGRFEHVDCGPGKVRTLGIVSGGGGGEFPQAMEAGLDGFITGELGLVEYHQARLLGGNYAAAGHYATERFGVCALGEALSRKFGIPWEFIDFHLAF